MKFVKILLYFIAVIVVIFLVLSFIGPSSYKVERTAVINATPEQVFKLTADFHQWPSWSPWQEIDPTVKNEIIGDEPAVGNIFKWEGDPEKTGTGQMEIIEMEENAKLLYKLSFVVPFEMGSTGGFTFETDESNMTKVTWWDEGEIDFLFRAMMLFQDMDAQLGGQFERGLENIKAIAEDPANAVSEVEISIEEVASVPYLYISDQTSFDGDSIKAKLGSAYGELVAFVQENGIEMAGARRAVTTEFSMEKMFYAFDAGLPVNIEEVETTGRIQYTMTYGGKAVKGIHIGPYEECTSTYDAIMKYIEDNGLEIAGNSWEEYIDDPMEVAPEELRTFIFFPIK